jgi:hypothetical protein
MNRLLPLLPLPAFIPPFCTLHSAFCTLHSSLCILHSALCTPHQRGAAP